MKLLRPVAIAVLLVGAFFYFTTYRSGTFRTIDSPTARVEITEAASNNQLLDSEEQNNISVYRKNIGSVVNVTSRVMALDFFFGAVPQEGQGSGFIIDRDGHILTNFHVIADASVNHGQIEVTLHNHKKFRASVVGTDRSHDLAIIQIKGAEVAPMTMGDSRNLQVGQKVYAIGNPFGLAGTLTSGIVSSIRSVQEPNGVTIDEAIQTDAAINPGNSGGPLLNWHGEVIGINTMIASNPGVEQSAGIGFAIPINTAKAILNDLLTIGRVRRPVLGVLTLPIGPDIADQLGLAADYGLLIIRVVPGSAADRAGLRAGSERAFYGNTPIMVGGDLIVAIDDQDVQDQTQLTQIMNNHRAGDAVKVTIYRGKRKMDVSVTLGEAREQL
ncbi:MAG: trypsin-like peptidase domain-containing protein [Acidobacteria bacterium]|nr:trypsin-like peptidase domain-containing protein [Acidobacteriota bacterium]